MRVRVKIKIKSNQIFICTNERSKKIDNNSDDEQHSKAQERHWQCRNWNLFSRGREEVCCPVLLLDNDRYRAPFKRDGRP